MENNHFEDVSPFLEMVMFYCHVSVLEGTKWGAHTPSTGPQLLPTTQVFGFWESLGVQRRRLHGGSLGHELSTFAPLHDPKCIVKSRLGGGFNLLSMFTPGEMIQSDYGNSIFLMGGSTTRRFRFDLVRILLISSDHLNFYFRKKWSQQRILIG